MKIWRAIMDDRTCPACAQLDGQVTTDAAPFHIFLTSHHYIYGPPSHLNCRCRLEFIEDDPTVPSPDRPPPSGDPFPPLFPQPEPVPPQPGDDDEKPYKAFLPRVSAVTTIAQALHDQKTRISVTKELAKLRHA